MSSSASQSQQRPELFSSPPSPKTIYKLGKEIGRGGFGMVRVSRDGNGNEICIKQVPLRNGAVDNAAEMALMRTLFHPNIVSADHIFFANNGFSITMRNGGRDLEQISRSISERGETISIDMLEQVAYGCLSALAFLDKQNIVHGDIKINNILWDGKSASIIDFGLAYKLPDSRSTTPNWYYCRDLRPEETWEKRTSPISDVWVLGCTLFEFFYQDPLFPYYKDEDFQDREDEPPNSREGYAQYMRDLKLFAQVTGQTHDSGDHFPYGGSEHGKRQNNNSAAIERETTRVARWRKIFGNVRSNQPGSSNIRPVPDWLRAMLTVSDKKRPSACAILQQFRTFRTQRQRLLHRMKETKKNSKTSYNSVIGGGESEDPLCGKTIVPVVPHREMTRGEQTLFRDLASNRRIPSFVVERCKALYNRCIARWKKYETPNDGNKSNSEIELTLFQACLLLASRLYTFHHPIMRIIKWDIPLDELYRAEIRVLELLDFILFE